MDSTKSKGPTKKKIHKIAKNNKRVSKAVVTTSFSHSLRSFWSTKCTPFLSGLLVTARTGALKVGDWAWIIATTAFITLLPLSRAIDLDKQIDAEESARQVEEQRQANSLQVDQILPEPSPFGRK